MVLSAVVPVLDIIILRVTLVIVEPDGMLLWTSKRTRVRRASPPALFPVKRNDPTPLLSARDDW